jgi:hypothetical protein
MFVLSNLSSYLAIDLLDTIAVATGLWCGVAIVVSFVFGAATEGVHHSVLLAVCAIAIMLVGIAGISHTQLRSQRCAPQGNCTLTSCAWVS